MSKEAVSVLAPPRGQPLTAATNTVSTSILSVILRYFKRDSIHLKLVLSNPIHSPAILIARHVVLSKAPSMSIKEHIYTFLTDMSFQWY